MDSFYLAWADVFVCAVGLLKVWDLGLETGSEWTGIRGGLYPGTLRAWKNTLSSQPLERPQRPRGAQVWAAPLTGDGYRVGDRKTQKR